MFNYLDLFAGAGGLSEGFIQAGFKPIAHVEMDEAACYTLKTRAAYHWLYAHSKSGLYEQYISGTITRDQLYESIPKRILDSVINYEISEDFCIAVCYVRCEDKLSRCICSGNSGIAVIDSTK